MARITQEAQAQTREKLLLAAADEFAEHGLAGANINRISVAAGLAKGTVYNYFDSKEDLFFAVVEEACRLAVEQANEDPRGTTRERLLALIASDIAWFEKHPAFARVFLRESLDPDPEAHARVMAAAAPFVMRVAQVLEEGVLRGEVTDARAPQVLAMTLVGLDTLALFQHVASGGAWPTLEEIPEFVVGQFMDGAAPR
ncbi:MAG: TetR/AcrR family transcriptional regulator [Polyangiaceae bacterium]